MKIMRSNLWQTLLYFISKIIKIYELEKEKFLGWEILNNLLKLTTYICWIPRVITWFVYVFQRLEKIYIETISFVFVGSKVCNLHLKSEDELKTTFPITVKVI